MEVLERERERERERESPYAFSLHPYGAFIITSLSHYNEI
jgi:hypothetical protein